MHLLIASGPGLAGGLRLGRSCAVSRGSARGSLRAGFAALGDVQGLVHDHDAPIEAVEVFLLASALVAVGPDALNDLAARQGHDVVTGPVVPTAPVDRALDRGAISRGVARLLGVGALCGRVRVEAPVEEGLGKIDKVELRAGLRCALPGEEGVYEEG